MQYSLIDSGKGKKLERFGSYTLVRPCSQAVWTPQKPMQEWNDADAIFSRDNENKWTLYKKLPESWKIQVSDLTFKISPTDFGHLGIFPEQKEFWNWIQKTIKKQTEKQSSIRVLNLFAYSGGSTLAAAKAGASVCHLDASKGMVSWARENAQLNQLEDAPIRWIVDDVKKFLIREIRRNSKYEAIILDPPTFGRGSQGEIFKIEEEIVPLLETCNELLSDNPLFVLFSCHTPGFTPITMKHLLKDALKNRKGEIESGEMILTGGPGVNEIPSGTYAKWTGSR